MLQAWCVLFAEGVTIVESAGLPLSVTRAVEDEAGPASRQNGFEFLSEREQERNLLTSVENAPRIVPAVPRERRAQAEAAPETVGEPEGERARQVKDPERVRLGSRQRAEELLDRGGGSETGVPPRPTAAMVMRRRKGSRADPGLERAHSVTPGSQGRERPRLGDRRECRGFCH